MYSSEDVWFRQCPADLETTLSREFAFTYAIFATCRRTSTSCLDRDREQRSTNGARETGLGYTRHSVTNLLMLFVGAISESISVSSAFS
jgi:hypothetical protein